MIFLLTLLLISDNLYYNQSSDESNIIRIFSELDPLYITNNNRN